MNQHLNKIDMTHHIVDGDTQSFTIFQTLLQDHQFHINTFGEEKVSTVVNPSSMKKNFFCETNLVFLFQQTDGDRQRGAGAAGAERCCESVCHVPDEPDILILILVSILILISILIY